MTALDKNDQAELLAQGVHADPHCFLGLHAEEKVIRLWRPGANEVYAEVQGQIRPAKRVLEQGLFEIKVQASTKFSDYKIYHSNGLLAHDPYAFSPLTGDIDLFLFNKGVHYELYNILGAHPEEHQGVAGIKFAVWAPNAKSVALVGDFNNWDGRINPMRSLASSGIWELFVPGLGLNEKYKFEIRTKEGYLRLKSDPYGSFFELRPLNATIVFDVGRYEWGDQAWIEKSREGKLTRPMNIYEVHLGSWRRYGDPFPNFREIARDLSDYCQEMGFTHVELMPVMEHPLDESW